MRTRVAAGCFTEICIRSRGLTLMACSPMSSVNSCSLEKASPPDQIAIRNHERDVYGPRFGKPGPCMHLSAAAAPGNRRRNRRRGGVELAGPGHRRSARGARNPYAATRGACRRRRAMRARGAERAGERERCSDTAQSRRRSRTRESRAAGRR
jgi:hypothetical protein